MIKNAKFISSAADLRGAPSLAKSEVAFLGRSNVGKSSLINALCHAKIAKSSATPGKTRLINFFDVEISANLAAKCENSGEILAKNSANFGEKFRLVFVDLPGFGYAKVGKKMREAWDKNLDEFLRKRVEIRLFVHLCDARHFELNFDEEISAYLKSLAKCDQMVLCVFTKADKLNQSQRARLKAKFPNALLVSSTTRQGLKELERVILDLVLGVDLGENLVNLHANLSEIQANLNRDISPCKSKAQYDKNSNINLTQTPPPNPLPQGEGALHAQISTPNSSLNSVQNEVKFTRKNLRNSQSPNHRKIAPYMQEFSRQMRQNLTDAENKLWQILRGKQLGAKFRRQFVVDDKYIADFICLKKRLIIECDGAQHNGNFDDIERDFYLVSKNFRILRFWNNEILENLESVVWKIKETLDAIDDFKGDNALATSSPISKKSSIGLISRAGALHAQISAPNSSLNSAQTPPPNPLPQGAGAFDAATSNKISRQKSPNSTKARQNNA